MSRFSKINEDPFYDDDGNCVDEDDWATAAIDIDEAELGELGIDTDNFSPHNTINS